MIIGPDPLVLDQLGDQVMARLNSIKGLNGIERTWQGTAQQLNLNVSPERARLYGLTALDVARQVAAAVPVFYYLLHRGHSKITALFAGDG